MKAKIKKYTLDKLIMYIVYFLIKAKSFVYYNFNKLKMWVDVIIFFQRKFVAELVL